MKTSEILEAAEGTAKDALERVQAARKSFEKGGFKAARAQLVLGKLRLKSTTTSVDSAIKEIDVEMADAEPDTPLFPGPGMPKAGTPQGGAAATAKKEAAARK